MRLRRRPAAPAQTRIDGHLRLAYGALLDELDAAPDPRERFTELDDDLWALLLTRAYDGWPRLQAALPGVPEPEWQRVWNGRDGVELAEQSLPFYRLLRDVADRRLGGLGGTRVLDFGCGWGRLTRMLTREVPADRLCGCDPVEGMLRYGVPATLARHDPHGERLPFDGPFDLAFAFSVFTHLSEAAHERALTALHHGLRPGGILVVTLRPPGFVAGEGDFVFAPHPPDPNHPQHDMGYGDTVVTLDYVRERWAPRFALLETRLIVGDLQQVALVLERSGA